MIARLLHRRSWWHVGALLAAVTLYLAAIPLARIAVTDRAGKVWHLRMSNVWRMAGAAVESTAPAFHPLFIAALVVLVAGAPLVVWLASRVRDAPAADVTGESSVRTVPELRQSGFSGAWIGIAATVSVWAVIVMASAALRPEFANDGRRIDVPSGYTAGAHGLHVSQAESLRRSLMAGESLQWVAAHQGGYPIEAAPAGFAWFTLAVWTVLLGLTRLVYAYAVAAAVLFLVPIGAFIWMARRDGWPASVPCTASVLHLIIPGGALSGGYRTLAELGKVDDIAGATLAALFLPCSLAALSDHKRTRMGLAALIGVAAIYCSPTSAVLIAVMVTIITFSGPADGDWLASLRVRARRAATLAAVIAAATSPIWIALLRSRDLYKVSSITAASLEPGTHFFAWMDAVTPPVLVLALAGILVAAYHRQRSGATRTASLTLVLVAVMSAFADPWPGLPYIDAARFLPFERLLLLYLAGVGLHAIVRLALAKLSIGPVHASDPAHLIVIVLLVGIFAGPWATLRPESKALAAPATMGSGRLADFVEALEAARDRLPIDSAVLVLGDRSFESLWAPVLRDGLYFYDDPLWHWGHTILPTYEPIWDSRIGAGMPEVLASNTLRARGIGAVIAAEPAQDAAREALATLTLVRTGVYYDAYLLSQPTPSVEWRGRVTSTRVTDREIAADGVSGGGDVLVHRNWHPRWRAFVNHRPVPLVRTRDGMMKLSAPPGPLALEMRFTTDPGDWLARGAAAAGLATALFWLSSPAISRRARSSSSRRRRMPWGRIFGASIACAAIFVGVRWSSFVAAGPDASGYISQASRWISGELTYHAPAWVEGADWHNAVWTSAPVGYRPGTAPNTIVPVYPPGLPIIMAAFEAVAGPRAVFYVVPLLGAAAVFGAYAIASRFAGAAAGVIAAALVLASPAFLIMLVQPMSDVPAAAFWTLAIMATFRPGLRGALAAALATAVAVLIRPNLAPLALVIAAMLAVGVPDMRARFRRVVVYGAAMLPAVAAIAIVNWYWHGSPLRSGYGTVENLYSAGRIWTNLQRYGGALLDTQTPFVLLAFLLPLFVARGTERARATLVAVVFPLAVLALYLPYERMSVWWFLRFLLPAYPPLLAAFGAMLVLATARIRPRGIRYLLLAAGVAVLTIRGFVMAQNKDVFRIRDGDRRYAAAVEYVRTLPNGSVLVSLLHSGPLHYYTGRDVLRWDVLEPSSLDAAVAHIRGLGHPIYVVADSAELDGFMRRFAGANAVRQMQPELAVRVPGGVFVWALANSPLP